MDRNRARGGLPLPPTALGLRGERCYVWRMKGLIITIALFTSIWPMLAQEISKSDVDASKHPIEIAMERKIEENPSTAGMIEAITDAHKAWDALLNRNYQKLQSLLSEDEAVLLKGAQRAWIAFRDMEGTMYRPMHNYAGMDLVKARALELGRRLEMIENQ
jgi:uncharacterized protein YecT (DUF1311 family)